MNILVIGDALADRYMIGHTERQSPEDNSVPVIDIDHETWCPGGVLNVAANLASLSDGGANITLASAVADATLSTLEDEYSVWSNPLLIPISDHEEIVKTRIICNGRQIARVDSRKTFSPSVIRMFNARFLKVREFYNLKHYDGVIVSDYAKGLITPTVVEHLESADIPVFIDTKVPDLGMWRNVKQPIVKLNAKEFAASQWPWLISDIIVTRSAKSTQLYKNGNMVKDFPIPNVKAFNTIGAGDVFLAGLAWRYLQTGGDMEDAILYGNRAAQVAVQRPLAQTPVVSSQDLEQ